MTISRVFARCATACLFVAALPISPGRKRGGHPPWLSGRGNWNPMQPMRGPHDFQRTDTNRTRRVTSAYKPISLLILGVCSLLVDCGLGPHTNWSAESRSPDGRMIAKAKATEWSGLGTCGAQTLVDLNWIEGSHPPTEILEFISDVRVGMNWVTPTHLELTYEGQLDPIFQAAKFAGIDVSVRHISNGREGDDDGDSRK